MLLQRLEVRGLATSHYPGSAPRPRVDLVASDVMKVAVVLGRERV